MTVTEMGAGDRDGITLNGDNLGSGSIPSSPWYRMPSMKHAVSRAANGHCHRVMDLRSLHVCTASDETNH